MTSGPSAELAEIIKISFPRPRVREEVLDLPEFSRIKKHIIQFLKNCAREQPSEKSPPEPDPVLVAERIGAEV
jgi:nitrate/nitrite transport system ATP-binding protein